MAPELRQGAELARPSSDMFSFGVMAYEVFAGRLPSDQPPMYEKFQPGKRWFPSLSAKCPDISAQLVELIESCLDPHPDKRPTAAQVDAALARL